MSTDDKKQEAMELVSKAYQHHMRGEVERAIELYTKSLELFRTPEAYTYRGWARSFQKDFPKSCRSTIGRIWRGSTKNSRVDLQFGQGFKFPPK